MTICKICDESYNTKNNIKDVCKECNILYCVSCMERWMITKIKDNNITIRCMCVINKTIIKKELIKTYLAKSDYLVYQKTVRRSKHINNCPLCMAEFYNPKREKKITCKNCGRRVCMTCEKENHLDNIPCEKFDIGIDDVHQCPNCDFNIIKDKGCDHMVCAWCKHDYYYSSLRQKKYYDQGLNIYYDRQEENHYLNAGPIKYPRQDRVFGVTQIDIDNFYSGIAGPRRFPREMLTKQKNCCIMM